MLEQQIEDYWNVDGEKELSDAWTGLTRFEKLKERPPEGFSWSGRNLQENKQPLAQTKYGQKCGRICLMQRKKKAKQRWAIEKRGIFFMQPNDEEFKLTIKAVRRKLEVPMPAAMPCKITIKSSGKTTAVLDNARQNMLVLLMSTKARDQG